MKTTKSTLCVARMALWAARDSLPDHAKAKSPRKFTQPQLVTCLVIKEFLQLDYRGIHGLLKEWSDLDQLHIPDINLPQRKGKSEPEMVSVKDGRVVTEAWKAKGK